MSVFVPCPACARAVAVAADQRGTIRCPECDLAFDLPVGAQLQQRTESPAAAPIVPSDAITAGAAPHAVSPHRLGRANIGDTVVVCRNCREPLWTAMSGGKRPTRCPQCGNVVPVAVPKKTAKAKIRSDQIKAPGVIVEQQASEQPDSEGNDASYGVIGTLRHCPNCERAMADDGILCLACGYNMDTGAQAVREFEPVLRSWDGALPYRSRMLLMGAGQAIGVFGLIGAFFGGFLLAGVFTWIGFTALLVYLLGTFDRIDIARSPSGHIKVTKTWRVFFVERSPTKIVLNQYAGVTTGMRNDVDGWDILMLGIMLALGVIPGILWWYCAFHRETFYVGLLREHGAIALELYRGWNQAQTQEIAKVVRDVAGFS
jgi:hypothetical protein